MVNKEVISVALVFSFLVFLPLTSAVIGVSPAAYDVDFQPGLERSLHFDFIVDSGVELDIYVEGDLAQYARLSTDHLKGSGRVQVDLMLPADIEIPGTHRILIGAQQTVDEENGFGLVGNIRGVIKVHVPYPGQYAEVRLSATNANAGQPVNLEVHIDNLGKETITAHTLVEIHDQSGTNLQTLDLGSRTLNSTESTDVKSQLITTAYRPGDYTAVAVVSYSDAVVRKEQVFRLGELAFGVRNYTQSVLADKINRFEVEAESFWNDPVEGVYANVSIIGTNVQFLTPSVRIDGFTTGWLTGYMDTTAIEGDTVQAKIILHYQGKTSEKIVPITIQRENSYALYGTFGAVAIVVIGGVFFFLRRHNNGQTVAAPASQ